MISITEPALEALLLALPYEKLRDLALPEEGKKKLVAGILSKDSFWQKLIARDYPVCNVSSLTEDRWSCNTLPTARENYESYRKRGLHRIPIIFRNEVVDSVWLEKTDSPSTVLTDVQETFSRLYPAITSCLIYVMVPESDRDDGSPGTYLLKRQGDIKLNITYASVMDTAFSIQVSEYTETFQEDKYPPTVGILASSLPDPDLTSLFEISSKITLDNVKAILTTATEPMTSNIVLVEYDFSSRSPGRRDQQWTIMTTDQEIYKTEEFVPEDFIGDEFGQKYFVYPLDNDLVGHPYSQFMQERRIARKYHLDPNSWFDMDEDNVGYAIDNSVWND